MEPDKLCVGLTVSPDCKLAAFTVDINEPYYWDLYIKDLTPGGKIRRITDKGTSGGGIDPVFSPDSKLLAFVEDSNRTASEFHEIKIVSLKDGTVRTIARIGN